MIGTVASPLLRQQRVAVLITAVSGAWARPKQAVAGLAGLAPLRSHAPLPRWPAGYISGAFALRLGFRRCQEFVQRQTETGRQRL